MTRERSPLNAVVRRLRDLGLTAKLVLFSATLTAIVVGAAFVALNRATGESTRRFVTSDLRDEQQVLVDVQHRTLTELLTTSSLLTQSPMLRAAMETYRLEAGSDAPNDELLATIDREATKIVAGLDRDLLVVTDERGLVLASVERGGSGLPVGSDLSLLPALARALDPKADIDRSNFAIVETRGHRYHAGVVPIVLQGFIIGTLALGDRLDDGYVEELQTSFRGNVAITLGDRAIHTTLNDVQALDFLRARQAHPTPDQSVLLGNEEFVVASLSLGADYRGRPVGLHLLHSITDIASPVNRAFLSGLATYGTLAVVLAALGAGAVSRSVLAPLNQFVAFVRTEAAATVRSGRFELTKATPELVTLSESYNQLMESLTREHEQLQRRTSELGEANRSLTEEISERVRVEGALRDSEEQLRQSQKMEAIGTLAGGVAHDFNNLLTVMLSYTDMALEGVGPDSPVVDDLIEIREAAGRATGLTNQLLAFSRKQVLRPKVLDLNTCVASVEKMLRRLIGEDVEVRTVTHTPLPKVNADPGQVEQVLVNLAVNARDAMPTGGTLLMETKPVVLDPTYAALKPPATAGAFVMIAVSDTGVGMAPATRDRIFEPFFTTKDPGKGTGLGLSTVYGIVKQSGGFIWVYSEPHRGTTFKIYLPQVTDASRVPTDIAPIQRALNGSETVLLVEDDESVRNLAKTCLTTFGYQVLATASPRDAIAASRNHRGTVDLLLTDVVLPEMSGKALASRLRRHRPQMRVLYMSGYTDEAVRNHGIVEPGTQFLQKPFDPPGLAGTVRRVLDTSLREAV